MGQPLKCLWQNDLQKCPVENFLFRGKAPSGDFTGGIVREVVDRIGYAVLHQGKAELFSYLVQDKSISWLFLSVHVSKQKTSEDLRR